MQLTPKQQKKLEKIAKMTEDDLSSKLAIIDSFEEVEEKVEEISDSLNSFKDEVSSKLDEVNDNLKKKLEEELVYEVDENKIVESVISQIAVPKDEEDYVLTDEDKKDIAKSIEMPVVEKVIVENTVVDFDYEKVKEYIPLVPSFTDIRNAFEVFPDEDKLKTSAIYKLDETLENLQKDITNSYTRVISNNRNLYNLLDVNLTGLNVDDSIKWDGTQWIPYTPSTGGGTWGSITGDLSDQIDLQNALNLKANSADLGAVAFSNDYNDLDNTPDLSNFLESGDDVSELNNDAGYTVAGDFGAVAFSNDYDDLDNKPTIPDISGLVTLNTDQDLNSTKTFPAITDEVNSFAVNPPASGYRTDVYCAGMSFEVLADLTVERLGRFWASGNTSDRDIRLYVSTDTVNPIASGTILNSSTTDSDGFKWVSVTPVVLTPGNLYYLVADEISGENWKDLWIPVLEDVFTNITSAFGNPGGPPLGFGPAGHMYGQPALGYTFDADVAISNEEVLTPRIRIPGSYFDFKDKTGTDLFRIDAITNRFFWKPDNTATGIYAPSSDPAFILNSRIVLQDQNTVASDRTATVLENKVDPFNPGRTSFWIYPEKTVGNGQRFFLGSPNTNQKWSLVMSGVRSIESFPAFIAPNYFDPSGQAAMTWYLGFGQSFCIRHYPGSGSFITPAYFVDNMAQMGEFHFKAMQTDGATIPQSYVFDRNVTITKGYMASFRNNGTEVANITYNGGITPGEMDNADAENNTIFISTGSGLLSFKDSAGTVHDLY
jgi:hypothetical protein